MFSRKITTNKVALTEEMIQDFQPDSPVFIGKKSIYPLDAPGMPLPSPEFLEFAKTFGDDTVIESQKVDNKKKMVITNQGQPILDLIHRMLTSVTSINLPPHKGTKWINTASIPGHLWSHDQPLGFASSKVMVVGKAPARSDLSNQRNFTSPAGETLIDAVRRANIKGIGSWYVTNLMKCPHPDDSGPIRAKWLNFFLHLLHQEIRLVAPKFIVCLGAEPAKVFLKGKTASLTMEAMAGRLFDCSFPASRVSSVRSTILHTKVYVVHNPGQFVHEPENLYKIHNDFQKFGDILSGEQAESTEEDIYHLMISDEAGLKRWLNRMRGEKRTLFAVDAEWEGNHPSDRGSYLRNIQFSWESKYAAVVRLRDVGGVPCFSPSPERAISLLAAFFQRPGIRVGGHFFTNDLTQLKAYGLDLRQQFIVPNTPGPNGEHPFELVFDRGGFDTGLMAHAAHETAELGLDAQVLRYTNAPKYWLAMDRWKKEYAKSRGISEKYLEGYGQAPAEILDPYSAYDADCNMRILGPLQNKVRCDVYGNNSMEPYYIAMRAALAILEMQDVGMAVDRDRLDYLYDLFAAAKTKLLAEIRDMVKWPNLNLSSPFQVRELLFGTKNNGKDPDENGVRISLREAAGYPQAISLELKPIVSTGKQGVEWSIIELADDEDSYTAKTDKTVLGTLYHEAEGFSKAVIEKLMHYRYVGLMLQNFIRPPRYEVISVPVLTKSGKISKYKQVEDPTKPVRDENGNYVYASGLGGLISDSGHMRTRLSPTAESGRWRSFNPNMQNFAASREKDYKTIFGDSYQYGLRSVFHADPGYVFVSADYSGAELLGMALMSGDKRMIDHCLSDYDIHSNVAVLAFRLTDVTPTKKGLKDKGKEYLRNIAKTVMFGIAYGRGARAIALTAKEQGVSITVEEAQDVINTIFTMYPELKKFFQECKDRAQSPGWLCGIRGRYRRFAPTDDRKKISDNGRIAMNFPIQNLVAEAVNCAVDHLYEYRFEVGCPEMYRLCLAIHDEIILQVQTEYVDFVKNEVLPYCMIKKFPIYPCTLSGVPTGKGPYYFKSETEVAYYWDETPSFNLCRAIGLDMAYGVRYCAVHQTLNGTPYLEYDDDTGFRRYFELPDTNSETLQAIAEQFDVNVKDLQPSLKFKEISKHVIELTKAHTESYPFNSPPKYTTSIQND